MKYNSNITKYGGSAMYNEENVEKSKAQIRNKIQNPCNIFMEPHPVNTLKCSSNLIKGYQNLDFGLQSSRSQALKFSPQEMKCKKERTCSLMKQGKLGSR